MKLLAGRYSDHADGEHHTEEVLQGAGITLPGLDVAMELLMFH